MGAKEIMTKKFDMGLKGYKTEEVEEFLREVSLEFKRLQDENENLEKKLDVLADKIREYRDDEDTLKDALLGAQRQGNALIADSKRKAAMIVEDAQANSAKIIKKAEEDRQALQKKGENEIAAARREAADIIADANDKAAEIELEMNLKTDVQKEILHRTMSEVLNFKARIISSYKEQMSVTERIAEDCENEFIKKTLKEGKPDLKSYAAASDKKNKERNAKAKGKTQQLPETAVNAPNQNGNAVAAAEPVKFEVDLNAADDTGEVPLFPSESNGKTGELFFKKEQQDNKNKSNNPRAKAMRFGGNNN